MAKEAYGLSALLQCKTTSTLRRWNMRFLSLPRQMIRRFRRVSKRLKMWQKEGFESRS